MTNHKPALSVIPDMTVSDVRKGLTQIRQRWAKNSPTQIFCPSDSLLNSPTLVNSILNDKTMEEFAVIFVLGHHKKRHARVRAP